MRLLVDCLIVLMLLAVLALVFGERRRAQHRIDQLGQVYRALSRLQEQARYHGAMDQALRCSASGGQAANSASEVGGMPELVSPAWFGSDLPHNVMVGGTQPWLDIAPPGDTADDPPDPVIHRPDQAGFWYNPARGVFRARVAPQFSEQETLDLYNELNNRNLTGLPTSNDPARRPLPCRPRSSDASAG
jgi:type II secretory pathway pseudopilin PulG